MQLTLHFLLLGLAQSLEFLSHPRDMTVVNGTEVEFSCIVAKGSDSILFLYIVNDTYANEQIIIDKGFIELGIVNTNSTTKVRNLTATALTQYNNTEIQCKAIVIGKPVELSSDIGILLVQGLLSSVVDISHFIDSSSLNISWNPPFTLPGTHITGYNISVTSIMFDISQFITDTYYVLTAPNNTDPCDEISITVSGYNGAGKGEMTTISSLYFQKTPLAGSNIPISIELIAVTLNMVSITVFINVSELCSGEYPTTIDILITNSTDDTTFTDIMLMEGSQDNILTTVDAITLQSDMIYTAQVILDGQFSINPDVNFTTFDTQSIDITSTSGEVCAVCRFSINTTAVGCEIQLLRNNNITWSMKFERDANIAEGCMSNIITGYYDLYVYDVENDNTLSLLPAAIIENVFVDKQATTPILIITSLSISVTSITATTTPTTFITTSHTLLSQTSMTPNPEVAITEDITDNTIIITTTTSIGVFILGLIGFTIVVVMVYTCATFKKTSGQSLSVQTNPAYADPRDITNTIISSERSFNHRVLLNKNPAYQDIHSIQTNTPVYENIQQTSTPVYENVQQTTTPVYDTVQQTTTPVYETVQQTTTPVYENVQHTTTLTYLTVI